MVPKFSNQWKVQNNIPFFFLGETLLDPQKNHHFLLGILPNDESDLL